MSQARVAIRYAKALLELAVEQGVADIVETDMRTLSKAIDEVDGLKNMLRSPVVSSERKENALESLSLGINPLSRDMVHLLLKNKRIEMIQEVALSFRSLYQKLKEQDVAYVTSAVPITDELKDKILQKVMRLTGNQIVLKNIIDKSIIGGFILRVGDIQYNASIANTLGSIKREFIQST